MAVELEISPVDIAIVLAVGAAAFIGYKAIKLASSAAGDLATAAGQAIDQARANVVQTWNNLGTVAPRTDKWYLYSAEAYTGIDAYGQSALEGANARDDFRRYEAEFRAGEAAQARPRATTTSEGAAFGIYPRP